MFLFALLQVYLTFTLLHVYITIYLTVARSANFSLHVNERAAMLAFRWAFILSSSARLLTLGDIRKTGRCKPQRCQTHHSEIRSIRQEVVASHIGLFRILQNTNIAEQLQMTITEPEQN
uniref:Putative secreted protein n=1 Tax=Ixodes ricinus TaxID=34613 RepID=A0A6B0UM26_IXORI